MAAVQRASGAAVEQCVHVQWGQDGGGECACVLGVGWWKSAGRIACDTEVKSGQAGSEDEEDASAILTTKKTEEASMTGWDAMGWDGAGSNGGLRVGRGQMEGTGEGVGKGWRRDGRKMGEVMEGMGKGLEAKDGG